jgi:hypothetical protein
MLYGFVFGFVLHMPLTIGTIADLMKAKRAYAEQVKSPKLVIFAGSNARFSHRCETIEAMTGIPCVNFGIGRGIGIDYLLANLKPVLRKGDVVYMPFEYDWYLDGKPQVMDGPDAALMWYGDKSELFDLGAERTLRAFFHFDLPFAISALTEMGLDAIGFRRRFGLQTLTKQGDEKGHTPNLAAAYADYVASTPASIPSAQALDAPSYIKGEIVRFLVWARGQGVTVIGGLQTAPDDAPVTEGVVRVLRRFYEKNGQAFLALDNRSLYPRRCFYDTVAHLNEPCQIKHSAMLASVIAAYFDQQTDSAPIVSQASSNHLHVAHVSAPR